MSFSAWQDDDTQYTFDEAPSELTLATSRTHSKSREAPRENFGLLESLACRLCRAADIVCDLRRPSCGRCHLRVINAKLWGAVRLSLMISTYLLWDFQGVGKHSSSIDVWVLKSAELAMIWDQVSSESLQS